MLLNKIRMVAAELLGNFRSHRQEFGIAFALRTLVYSAIWRAFDVKSSLYINSNLRLLKDEFRPLIDKFNSMHVSPKVECETKIIWVCWWQGLDSMPAFCKLCYNHLINNTPKEYQVVLITENNFRNYVSLPDYILDKYNKGIIKIQAFSDLLRQALLWQVGGIWMDATLFTLPGYLENINKRMQFWSVNLGRVVKRRQIGQIITNCHWSGFIQSARKGNIVNGFVYKAMCDYYLRHNQTLDYFIQNFLFRIAKENIPEAQKIFDDIHVSNPHLYDLSLCINESFNQERWDEMCRDTRFFKLTYKVLYNEYNGNSTTFYHHIKNL